MEKVISMDLATLTIFCTVAGELSVTRAAKQLGRVPSNVTTRIQQLEAELGIALFDRHGKRLSLTAEGQKFLGYAERILNLINEAMQVLNPSTPCGTFRVGAMECTVASRLPNPLASFHQQCPDVTIEVTTSPSRQLLNAVLDNRLDCALLAVPPQASAEEWNGAELRSVFREELLLILPADHPRVQSATELRPRTLAAFAPGCTYREIATDWLNAAEEGSSFAVHSVASYHAMLACVASGTCISVMPKSVFDLIRTSATLQTQTLLDVETVLAWRKGYSTPAFEVWRDTLNKFSDLG
jgi:DNA-binding transcriptional LysR family regulator